MLASFDDEDVTTSIAEDAETINVGMIMSGGGQASIDDVSLEIVQKDAAVTGKTTRMSQLQPGLFEIRGGTEYEYQPSSLSRFAEKLGLGSGATDQKKQSLDIHLLIFNPSSYSSNYPLTYDLSLIM